MLDRLDLSKKLRALLGSDNVYFQPSSNVTLKYPAIRYSVDGFDVKHCDNRHILNKTKYTITHMYKSPTKSLVKEFFNSFEYISFDRRIMVDGLYNDVYEIYW